MSSHEHTNHTPEGLGEGTAHRWKAQGESTPAGFKAHQILTGWRYPTSIFVARLDTAEVRALLQGIEGTVGDPTPEQWLQLRAAAAERRLRGCSVLVDGIAEYWVNPALKNLKGVDPTPVTPGDDRLLQILASVVEDRLLSGRPFDGGARDWRVLDTTARRVLALPDLVRRDTAHSPRAALDKLAARIAGSIRKDLSALRDDHAFRGEFGTHDDGDAGVGGAMDPCLLAEFVGRQSAVHESMEDLDTINRFARRLASAADAASVAMIRFLERPELWDLDQRHQAEALGLSYPNWRQMRKRAFLKMTTA